MGNVAKKVVSVGRATTLLVGLAVILALVFGAATTALGANGKPFLLGKKNVATAVSTLVKKGPGPALRLVVAPGQPPLAVNSAGKVANLNADQLDGKDSSGFYAAGSKVADSSHADQADSAANAETVDGKSASQIGVNGLERVSATTPSNSNSGKTVTVICPAGKVLVGASSSLLNGSHGIVPDAETDVAITQTIPAQASVTVGALEVDPTSESWSVTAHAICATAP